MLPRVNNSDPDAGTSLAANFYLSSASPAPRLRIGLLIDTPEIPAVFARVISDIQRSDFADVVCVIRNMDAKPPSSIQSLPRRVWKFLSSPKLRQAILYAVYVKLDEWRSYDPQLDPLKPVDCSSFLRGIPQISVFPATSGPVHRFSEADIAQVKAADLDVIVRFGFNILKGDILGAARYGVWSYHHGDNDLYRGSPPYMWEMMEGSPRCGAVLQILTETLDGGLVIAKGQYACESAVSLFRNRLGPFWGSCYFLVWKLRELHEKGFPALRATAVPRADYGGRKALYSKSGNREMLGWMWRLLVRKLGQKRARRMLHWQTALRRNAVSSALHPASGSLDLSGFQFLKAPAGHFYADPFLFERDGRTFLFMEDYDYAAARGDLVVMDVTDGVPEQAEPCLATGSHLSYPFVFAHGGEIWMIPESMAAGEVALYRAEAFPHRWVKEKVLFSGPVVDTTVWQKDGTWYFFATLIVPGTEAVSLHLFTADSLTGDWRLHPASPLSNDVRDARGAGRLFMQDGVLYRPAQDCSGTYGRAIRLFRVDEHTPSTYAESLVMEVGPQDVPHFAGRGAEGIHTYDRAGTFEVIDAKFSLPVTEVLGG